MKLGVFYVKSSFFRHLNALSLDSIVRPHLLICDIVNAVYNPPKRGSRDEELMTTILQTLRAEGDVLVAIDTAGRVLELACMLVSFFKKFCVHV